jgi:hypothetical protein
MVRSARDTIYALQREKYQNQGLGGSGAGAFLLGLLREQKYDAD